MSREKRECDGDDQGFALIFVLWIGIVLAAIAAAFANSVRGTLRDTAARTNRAQAEQLAAAGIQIGLLGLSSPNPAAPYAPRFNASSKLVVCQVPGAGLLRIEIEDEEGKINLNSPNASLLIAFFIGLGASQQDASSYAARIEDFRDFDDDKRPDGAERDDYLKSGAALSGPKNSDFLSVSEIDQVLGIPADFRERAKPFLTTLSQSEGVDPGQMPQELAEILTRGTRSLQIEFSPAEASALPPSFRSVSSRRSFSLVSEAFLENGSRYAVEALVRLPDSPTDAPQFRRWGQTSSRLPPDHRPLRADSAGPC